MEQIEQEEQPVHAVLVEPEPSASAAQVEPMPYAELILLCHPRKAAGIADAFAQQIQDAEDALPFTVFSKGRTSQCGLGIVILDWEGIVDPAFLAELQADDDIFDFYVHTWMGSKDAQEDGQTRGQTGNNDAQEDCGQEELRQLL